MNRPEMFDQGAGWGSAPPPVLPLPFTGFDDITIDPQKTWLLKGVAALGETSSWIGQPGSGKSALLSDLSVCVAGGRDWRGHRSKGAYAVIYFAFERGDLLKRRLEAYRRKYGYRELPIAIVTTAIDFMASGSIDIATATVRAVEDRFSLPVGMIVLDTFAKAIALGGGEENSAKDQNTILGHLRLLQAETGVHIALVGHTGKDAERGARGSNAHVGDVDLMVTITGEAVKEATITKANDQAEGRLTTFALETFDFGQDEDGDPITTSILAADAPEQEPRSATGRLPDRIRLALDALDEALGAHGDDAPPALQLPRGVKCVSVDRWKDELIARGILERDDPHLRQSFYKVRVKMTSMRLIGMREDMAWRAQ